jgi:hypothetical protein
MRRRPGPRGFPPPDQAVGKLENLFEVDGNRYEQEAGERGRRAMDPTKKSCHADGSKDVIAPSVATGWSTGGDPHGAD